MLTIINTENDGVRLQTDNVPILTKLRDAGWTGDDSNVFYIPLNALIVPFVEDEDRDKSVYVTDGGGGTARLEKTITVTFSLDDIAFVDSAIFNGSV